MFPTTRLTVLIEFSRSSFVTEISTRYLRITNETGSAWPLIELVQLERKYINVFKEINERTSLKHETHSYKGQEQNN
jgi:hypothetical protein